MRSPACSPRSRTRTEWVVRGTAAGRYLLANGRGARFAEPQALAKSEFIVAAELDGADRDARIFLAAPLEREDIERLFKDQIEERQRDRLG